MRLRLSLLAHRLPRSLSALLRRYLLPTRPLHRPLLLLLLLHMSLPGCAVQPLPLPLP